MGSVDEFLQTGRLGPLRGDMSKEEVREVLGEPESVSEKKSPLIWKYGSLQLAFNPGPQDSNPDLVSIALFFHTPDEHPPRALALDGWMPTEKTTFEEFRDHLADVGIPVYGGVGSGDPEHLVLESAVRVTFDEGRLYSIGYTMKRGVKEVKQVTVPIPLSELEAIRREASAHGISVSTLCSRWIGERVANLQHH